MNLCVILFFTKQKRSEEMFPYDYQYSSDGLFFKHELTVSPPCDAFSMHTHNYCELLYFLSGDATHVIEDRKYKLKKGDLIIIRPSKYHFIQIDSNTDYERYDILFDEPLIGTSLKAINESVEVINLAQSPTADGIFRRCDYYAKNLPMSAFSEILPLLIKELFYNISIEQSKPTVRDASAVNPILSKALAYINDELFTLKSVSEVAAKLFVTESYLFRIFKNELHQTPKKYITDKRLLAAQSMIRMGQRPTDVSEKCGFGDYTTFYRCYKRFFGVSPSEKNAP